MREIIITDLSGIDEAARKFLSMMEGTSIYAFYGPMGAGKTTFIAALCRAIGVEDCVNSPTFTIVNEYRAADGLPVYHFDFYRIDSVAEALDAGTGEYFDSDGLCLMEWPEKIEDILPPETLKVFVSVSEDGSRVLRF